MLLLRESRQLAPTPLKTLPNSICEKVAFALFGVWPSNAAKPFTFRTDLFFSDAIRQRVHQMRVVIAAVACLLAGACSSSEVTNAPDSTVPQVSCESSTPERTTHQYTEIDGVDSNLTSLDVWATPGAQGCPVVVWVHGGSWQAGDKSTRSTTVKAEHFVEAGFSFISVNYRLASETNDVRWPAFGDDVADAVAWIADNPELAQSDPEQVTLMGHSSGAHIVSILGAEPTRLSRAGASDVQCVISLDSVTQDLTDAPPWEVDIIELSFPDEVSKIDGSPTLQATGPEGPSVLIVTRGRNERLSSSARFADALTNAGRQAEVADVSPYDHGEVSTQIGVADEDVITPIVDNFVAGCANP